MTIFVIFYWYCATFWAYLLWVEYRRVLYWMIGCVGYIEGGAWMWWGRIKERIIGGGGAKIALHLKVFVGRCNIIIVWASIVGSKQLAWYCWGHRSDRVKYWLLQCTMERQRSNVRILKCEFFVNIWSQYCYCMSSRSNYCAFYTGQSSIGCMGMLGMFTRVYWAIDTKCGRQQLQLFMVLIIFLRCRTCDNQVLVV